MRERPYQINDKLWIAIPRAAKLLRTNALGIRKLMGEGKLDYCQTRANSRTFVVSHEDVMKLAAFVKPSPSKKAPIRRPDFEPVRRQRGGLWQDHHLRLTLPHALGEETKPDDD